MTLVNILYYEKENGRVPYFDWFKKLDRTEQYLIMICLRKVVENSKSNNVKYLNDGIYELKINSGPGYRIYFAKLSSDLFLILNAGIKTSQKRDIGIAKKFWSLYGWKK